ncbi:tyrosine-type recombinase/integrase [Leptospira yasudae]|uniref:tyrosine-type recombinase/integrase n=1 Tax=Leptospira yasudae TaxID=2202201 RepID=UPI0010916221|nr:tyrosine-type recombinase/integrase [Leptospira yasudae]MBW0433594.1 tyrosine-type recombinase/integrase [Leptospira yasudae]TGN00467.1 site-specific integrase [Leptospira yasudae]
MPFEKENSETQDFKNILTNEEVRKLIDAARNNPDHYVWIRFLFLFGLKPEELVSIRCSDVNLETRILRIRGFDSRKDRFLDVPFCLSKDFYAMTKGKKPEEFLFRGRNGKLHRKTIQKLLQKLKRKTEIEVNIPKIRRTIAVRMEASGVSIRFITNFLGFKTRRATYKLIGKNPKSEPVKIFPLDEILEIGA